MSNLVIIVRSRDTARSDDALRACVGLTLRGARLTVLVEPHVDTSSAAATRALGALASFGHVVHRTADVDALDRALASADAVEVWT